jgi:sensor histidine kinase YesM
MRFENKFHARIEADEEIDIHTCEIPSVLIQPFVENAINHGLFHKKSGGNLSVRFSDQKDGAVTCVIEDDGIGRKRAQALKEKSNSQHKSFGMQLVRERLEVLQHMDELKILFDIEDIDDQRTGHTGTRVTIKIPLMD